MMEYLNRIKVEEKLKSLHLLIFTPREFQDIFRVHRKTAIAFIGRNVKSGLFLKLRNGYYVLKDSHQSLYFMANKLYQPSYISLETALSYHHLIPETVYSITSVTTKPTREFQTPCGVFSYQRIKQSVFTGYHPIEIDGELVLFAEPEKALADHLYFVDLEKTSLNDRLNLREIKKSKLIDYVKLFKRPNLLKLIHIIYAQSRNPPPIY
jgi:predicted transcriptional regulator of viral defense system